MSRNARVTSTMLEDIRRRIDAGESKARIMLDLGLPHATFYRALRPEYSPAPRSERLTVRTSTPDSPLLRDALTLVIREELDLMEELGGTDHESINLRALRQEVLVEEIDRRSKSGRSITHLASLIGVNRSTLHRWLAADKGETDA